MYMVARKYKIKGNRQEIGSEINKRFIPLISKIKGFVDFCKCLPGKPEILSGAVLAQGHAGLGEKRKTA